MTAFALLAVIAAPQSSDTVAIRPNVLFVISDDQSYPHASAYGCKWVSTPGFDRVASSGVLFHNAFAPTPGCSPTRACVLTGRHAWRNREAGTHASSFPADLKTFPDLLESSGYHVGYTGKGWSPGNSRVSGRNRNPAGTGFNKAKKKPAVRGIAANDYATNFDQFLQQREDRKPFCFWFGAHEPHRGFEQINPAEIDESTLNAVKVPPYLPDVPEVRADLLAYAREVEWFDSHLVRMLDRLQELDELENTLVIVTSDNGMSFPRAKANLYEDGIHMPLAISWPKRVDGPRSVNDLVNLVDIMPTIAEATGLVVAPKEVDGRSLLPVLFSGKSGLVDSDRSAVFAARERHSSSRYHSLGYPQRAIRTQQFLYIRNYTPERWPAGAPQTFVRGYYPTGRDVVAGKLGPEHAAYHDIDGCPTLTLMTKRREETEMARCLAMAVDRRPAEELFDIRSDPACMKNLASVEKFDAVRLRLAAQLTTKLKSTEDPRENGSGHVFETYPRYSDIRAFPKPEWARSHPERVPKQPWWEKRVQAKAKAKQ